MYCGWQRGKAPSNEWIDQTSQFLNHAFSLSGVAQNGNMKCPCAMCRNHFRHPRNTIELHLCRHGLHGLNMEKGLLAMLNLTMQQIERVLMRPTVWIK